jgi:uncharacterized protein YndB with AHSA1/START domain
MQHPAGQASRRRNVITTVARKSDFELEATRSFAAPACMVFEAWTKPELFTRWWVPKSGGMSLISFEMDVRVGGGYRFKFTHPAFAHPMTFFGKYIEVTPNAKLSWSNDESEEGAITTVAFTESDSKTLVKFHERYPTKQGLNDAMEGSSGYMAEQFEQLDEMLAELQAASSPPQMIDPFATLP